jgi:diguanylate cyclase (GGDEF)-like protein
MAVLIPSGSSGEAGGKHFSCSITAVLLARVDAFGGAPAVAEVLERAGSQRSVEYLSDIANWISYDEAIALLRAGKRVTSNPQFARLVGEDAARRLNGSPMAAVFRSLGSPENVYRQIATSATKYSVVTRLETVEMGPGFAEIAATAVDGFPRDADHCAWTCGILSQPTILFGLAPAHVEHDECAALGAPCCRYRVSWNEQTDDGTAESERYHGLFMQLEAMRERLRSVYETASDLIGADEITDVLVKITDRAAIEIRAPRHLLVVTTQDGRRHCHSRGFSEAEAAEYAQRVLAPDAAALPDSALLVPVSSSRHAYGQLLAMYDEGRRFFHEERELLEVYARYAASALDSASALAEAQRRYDQSSALLELARALASAGTSDEIASRLANAVPMVVDCDRVGVYLWDPDAGEVVRSATTHPGTERPEDAEVWTRSPTPGGPLEQLVNHPRPEPIFVDANSGDEIYRDLFSRIGAVASILVPLTKNDQLLGLLGVSVMAGPHRLDPTPELLDQLSGVAAQATTALQNGRLVDQITHQALHDDLTGLANRPRFADELRRSVEEARQSRQEVTVFYVDLDDFKPVNDRFGHDTGDRVLQLVAQRLLNCAGSADTVARLGGDEFAILLGPSPAPRAAEVNDLIRHAFDDALVTATVDLHIGVSIGHATFPTDADDAERLLHAADVAMFSSKNTAQGAPLR